MQPIPPDSEFRLCWPEGGERSVVVLDFGPGCEGGYPAFTASEAEGEPVVRVSYACHPGGLCDTGDFTRETRAKYLGEAVDLPILPASTDRHDLFRVAAPGRFVAPLQQGLVRYVRFTLDTPGTAVSVRAFALENRGTHAEEPPEGAFECSDAALSAIWSMSVRTCQLAAIPERTAPLRCPGSAPGAPYATLGPAHAYLSDGAKRDRLVWSGDLWWAQRNMYVAWGPDSPYMPGSLRMLAENRTPEGYVQACPYPESHGPLAAGDYGPFPSDEFAAWFAPVLRDHVLYTGDVALARELFPVVRDLVAYLRAHCRADGLFEQRPETSKHASALDFGEASTYHRSYMDILLWKTFRDAADVAEWTGETALAAEWRDAAATLAATVRRLFWNAEKGRFAGALETDDYQGEANALALAARFCTEEEADSIRRTVSRHDHGKFQALFVRGLFEYGFADDALARIREHGWEKVLDPAWPGPRLTSECMTLHERGWGDEAHPDTAIAGILSNYVLGVEPTAPGYAEYRVRPRPPSCVESASGVVPTPRGALRVSWRRGPDGAPVVESVLSRRRGGGKNAAPAPERGIDEDDTRERLLRAGEAEFLEKGFRKARLADICRAAGCTTGPLYWHFRDKKGLFGALVADAYDAAVALQDRVLAEYRAMGDENKWHEAIYGGRSYVADLTALVHSRKDAFRLLVKGRAVGTKWDGLARLLSEREIEAEWPWIESIQKEVPGGPFPRESLVDLLHGANGALFKAAFRADTREEALLAAGKLHSFYVAGTCVAFGLAPDGSRALAARPPFGGREAPDRRPPRQRGFAARRKAPSKKTGDSPTGRM